MQTATWERLESDNRASVIVGCPHCRALLTVPRPRRRDLRSDFLAAFSITLLVALFLGGIALGRAVQLLNRDQVIIGALERGEPIPPPPPGFVPYPGS